jgi:CRISPR-associated protein Cas2
VYYIVVYDIGEERVQKMLKLMRQYLEHVQNSVFEGHLTRAQVAELKSKAERIMSKQYDSVIFYAIKDPKWLEKDVLGIEKRGSGQMI